jgi:hypothetical protein
VNGGGLGTSARPGSTVKPRNCTVPTDDSVRFSSHTSWVASARCSASRYSVCALEVESVVGAAPSMTTAQKLVP